MHRSRRAAAVSALALACLLPGCSAETAREAGRPGSAGTGSAPEAGSSAGAPSGTDTFSSGPETSSGTTASPGPAASPEPDATQPLVILMHATRPPVDLPEPLARRLVAGEVERWAELDPRLRGRLRMVRSMRAVVRDRSAVAVLPAAAADPRVQAARVAGVDPFRRPDGYPLRVEASGQAGPVVTLSVVGDIMLGRGVAEAAAGTGDPTAALRPMRRRLAAADVTVGNLESTLSRAGAPTQGDDSFAADPAVRRGLRAAGFDVLDLANNHLGDFGPLALVRTVRLLREGGFATFGAGATPRRAWRPAVVERSGIRLGFLGFNAIGETAEVAPGRPGAVSVSMPPRTGPLDRAELRRFLAAVRRLDSRVTVVAVFPHWGTQYTNVPEPVQHRVARRLVAAGADLVVGGHPHWVQGTRMVDGTLVAHSLGNFVFDMDFMEQTQRGLLLELTFWGAELKAARFVPYAMDGRFAPRVQSFRDGRDTLRLMGATSGRAWRARPR